MSDLVERLRHADANSQQRILGSRIFREAADRIEHLEAENAKWIESAAKQQKRAKKAEAALADARLNMTSIDKLLPALKLAEDVEAKLADARRQAFDEAAQIAELEGFEWVANRIRAKAQPHSETRQEQR
ncbi:hypothetical protein JVX98_13445 [Ensifer sp. PDNC004]|uniref:hypothetical protein n=1 Tax=Ensifer sp. PDNC004 TaxID=2811423 RepID=UPI00196682C7|nr:hypothetical protein [Ensifer sp. PDNC004]QRY69220.1 hypothetical protein JVX98_13445 [Ensifer sp. PDNC004]